jgi:hypothetical protein
MQMTEVNLKPHDSAGHGGSSGAFSPCKIAAQVVQMHWWWQGIRTVSCGCSLQTMLF